MGKWLQEAYVDAADAVDYFMDEIIEGLMEHGSAATRITDYSESYHHETHIDHDYHLKDAADLLDDLSDYEEEDSGLWEGQEPRRAIATMAAFTYGNAVYQLFSELMETINENAEEILEEGEEEISRRKRWGPKEELIGAKDKLKAMIKEKIARFKA